MNTYLVHSSFTIEMRWNNNQCFLYIDWESPIRTPQPFVLPTTVVVIQSALIKCNASNNISYSAICLSISIFGYAVISFQFFLLIDSIYFYSINKYFQILSIFYFCNANEMFINKMYFRLFGHGKGIDNEGSDNSVSHMCDAFLFFERTRVVLFGRDDKTPPLQRAVGNNVESVFFSTVSSIFLLIFLNR